MFNMEYDTKEKFYLSVTQFFRAMKRYCEAMEQEAAGILATPLPKSVRKSGYVHLHHAISLKANLYRVVQLVVDFILLTRN